MELLLKVEVQLVVLGIFVVRVSLKARGDGRHAAAAQQRFLLLPRVSRLCGSRDQHHEDHDEATGTADHLA